MARPAVPAEAVEPDEAAEAAPAGKSKKTLFIIIGTAWLATRWERLALKQRFRHAPAWLLLAPMLLSGAGLSAMETRAYFHTYNPSITVDAIAAGAALRAEPGIATKRVMAIHPIYAYEAGSRYVMTPLWYPGSILQFVRYELVRPRIKRYAPRILKAQRPTVLFLCADRGTPYLDTVFNPTWATTLE